jgi:hypothetical protein
MATDLTTPTEELTPDLLRQVRSLSPKARDELAMFIDELGCPPPPMGPDWAEVKRRIEEVQSGTAELLDGQEVLDRLRAKLEAKGLL